MKTPKKVNVIGKTWRIRRTKRLRHFGETDQYMQEISVQVKQTKEQEKDTVWHEIIHAIDESLKLGLKEHQVHALAAAQVQVMFDNPKLMEYLLK